MPFETWAIVEIMGRQQIAGKASEQSIAGVNMLRVDVPATDSQPEFTKFYSAGAIYSITPCDEAVATRVAEHLAVVPVAPWVLRMPSSPMLAEKISGDGEFFDPEDFEGDDEDDDEEDGRLFPNIDWARKAMEAAQGADDDGREPEDVGF